MAHRTTPVVDPRVRRGRSALQQARSEPEAHDYSIPRRQSSPLYHPYSVPLGGREGPVRSLAASQRGASFAGIATDGDNDAFDANEADEIMDIFDALDCVSRADVMRSVQTDAGALHATVRNGETSEPGMHPVDYAMQLAGTWNALLEHCDRTGVVDASALALRGRHRRANTIGMHSASRARHNSTNSLTLRDRLLKIDQIVAELLGLKRGPPPRRDALHCALRAKLSQTIRVLLDSYPSLACEPADKSLKTPLHVAASMIGTGSRITAFEPSSLLRKMLSVQGVSAGSVDADGRNPLHELVRSFSLVSAPYGLATTRGRSASLSANARLIALLIANGADPCSADKNGESPLSIAIRVAFLDYLTIVNAADEVYRQASAMSLRTQTRSTPTLLVHKLRFAYEHAENGRDVVGASGDFATLPDDVICRIMRYLSPRDAQTGLGSSSRLLRILASSPACWEHLSRDEMMRHVRAVIVDQ